MTIFGMDLEIFTHIVVLLFILGDFAWHMWKWGRGKFGKNKVKRYTLDEAKVILFESVALSDPEMFATPKRIEWKPNNIDMKVEAVD